MRTFLFNEIIFGPVNSRRLGISLGINLLPAGFKLCTFNCLYCECGWTHDSKDIHKAFPPRKIVYDFLEQKLRLLKVHKYSIDTITFAGNGEPTLHPEFAGIIGDAIQIRNTHYPGVKIAVLSNASTIRKEEIFQALKKIESNILKLDSGKEETIRLLNNPKNDFNLHETIKYLTRFNGDFILQTMFVRGNYQGKIIDNTTTEEIEAWLEALKIIHPKLVMVYTFARLTPHNELSKVPVHDLNIIADKVKKININVQVFG
ncbi:MAG: radical SAM protein [Bacteroidia bacterium]|nr:radical SAM protein [Bacteroidia bacterium]